MSGKFEKHDDKRNNEYRILKEWEDWAKKVWPEYYEKEEELDNKPNE